MAVTVEYIASIVSLLFFYGIIVVVGVVATIWFKRKYKDEGRDFDLQIVAGRKLGAFVGWLTMTGKQTTPSMMVTALVRFVTMNGDF